MIYEFFIDGISIELARQLVGFIESLKSQRYVYLEYRNKGGKKSPTIVKVICNREDYHEIFYWLRDKNLKANVLMNKVK